MLQQLDLNCILKEKVSTNKVSPSLQPLKKSINASDEYEEAISPCLLKKRMVQKGGLSSKSSEQLVTEQMTEADRDIESNLLNKENNEYGSSSIVRSQMEEIKIFQKKLNELNKNDFQKNQKSVENVQLEEESNEKLQKTSTCDLDQQNEQSVQVDQKEQTIEYHDDQMITENAAIKQQQKQSKENLNEQKLENLSEENLSLEEHQIRDNQNIEESDDENLNLKNINLQQQNLLQSIGDNQGNGSNKKTRICNCKKTKCIKLYCDCFAAGEFCGGDCNCCECKNTSENKEIRDQIIKNTLIKYQSILNFTNQNPEEAIQSKLNEQKKLVSKRGCNCRRSGCLKKYCQCYQDGLQCGEHCKCNGCENCDKSTKKLFLTEQNSISLQSQVSNSMLSDQSQMNASMYGSSQLINNQKHPNLSKQNSSNMSFNDFQKNNYQSGSPLNYNQQQNLNNQNNKKQKSINNTTNNETGFNFNLENSEQTANNSLNLFDENAQQLMLTQLLTNMFAQQSQVLINPLLQLATLQASLQAMLAPQTQQNQQQQNNTDNSGSLENILVQAAAAVSTQNNINSFMNYFM